MQIPKIINASLLSLLVALSMTAAAPVVAQGNDDTAAATTTSSPETTTESDGDHTAGKRVQLATSTQTENETEASASADDGQRGLHQAGASMLAELRKDHHTTKSAAQIEKQCEAHKQGLTTKFAAITTNSQRIQDHITDVLTKTQAYQQANNVQTADYATLLTAAQNAQTTSAASITALKAVTPTIDCNNTSTASDVATFKAAAQQTRDNLKAYRTAVKAVLADLKAAKTTTTEGSN